MSLSKIQYLTNSYKIQTQIKQYNAMWFYDKKKSLANRPTSKCEKNSFTEKTIRHNHLVEKNLVVFPNHNARGKTLERMCKCVLPN